jgi:hypothetical protein
MAFTEVARFATTTLRATATTATNTYTLPSAPASGQWIVVALYTNQGIIPAVLGITGQNNYVSAVSCGSVALPLLEGALLTTINTPTVFAAPYASGMTTTLSVTWSNNLPATTLGVAVLIFSGASTTTGSMAFRQSNGAFDGAGDTTFGLTQAQGSSGRVSWTQSNAAIPTNYDNQQQPFIAAIADTNVPTSATLQLARTATLFGVTSNSSGQLYQLGGTPGTLAISSATSVYNPAGATAYGVIYGTYGNFTFSYTGISGNNLTGCVATGLGVFAQAPSYAPIMLAGTSGVTITAILNTTSATVPNLNGFLTGSTSYTSGTATANGHVQIGIGGTGTVPARLHLIGGSNNSGAIKQTAYAIQRINGSNATNGGGLIYTFAPAVRTLTRVSSASRIMTAKALKEYVWSRLASAALVRSPRALKTNTFNRSSQATYVRAATAIKSMTFRRSASATMNYAVSSSKSRTFGRRAIATTVGIGQKIVDIFVKSHPGTVTSDFKTASVTGKSQTASVVGDFKTASVSTKVKFLVKD